MNAKDELQRLYAEDGSYARIKYLRNKIKRATIAELRKLLRERGVKFNEFKFMTQWAGALGESVEAYPTDMFPDTLLVKHAYLTPEQAIEITLERDNSDVVQRLMELRGGHYGWSRLYRAVTGDFLSPHTSCTEDEAKFIEKLLECMVGVGSAGTCHIEQTCHVKVAGVDYYDDDYECSECGAEMFEGFNFCPNCGRRVVEVDV